MGFKTRISFKYFRVLTFFKFVIHKDPYEMCNAENPERKASCSDNKAFDLVRD